MKKGFWAAVCAGILGAHVGTASAVPFELSSDVYGWSKFNFVGQELSTGQNVSGYFSFVTSGPGDVWTSPVWVNGSASFDVDRYFLAEANLQYDDGRFMDYAQQGACAETIGGGVGGYFGRGTPCGSTIAPELSFSLNSDLGFLSGYANSQIPFDELVDRLLSGPGLQINGRYGCSGGQLVDGGPANFGLNGSCGGGSALFGRYSGTLTAVPEPGTLALFGAAVLGLALTRRRRQPA